MPDTKFESQRAKLRAKLEAAEAARQSLEADLGATSYADLNDNGSRSAAVATKIAVAEADIRGLHAAAAEIDRAELAEAEAAEAGRRLQLGKDLDRALAALERADAKLADELIAFAAAKAAAEKAQDKAAMLASQLGTELSGPDLRPRLRFAAWRADAALAPMKSLELPAGWAQIDADAGLRIKRSARPLHPEPRPAAPTRPLAAVDPMPAPLRPVDEPLGEGQIPAALRG